jgi:transcriptional regulator with XRE-family HTH domain
MQNRIEYIMQKHHLTPARLADELKVQRSGISHILSGRNKPGYEFIVKIIERFPDINAEWFITGKGNPDKDFTIPVNNISTPLSYNTSQADLFAAPQTQSQPQPKSEPEVNEFERTLLSDNKSFNEINITNKQLEKIIFIYNDDTFHIYYPK